MANIKFLYRLRTFFWPFIVISLFSAASLIPFAGIVFLITLPAVLYIFCFLNNFPKTFTAFLGALCLILILFNFMQTLWPVLALMTMGLAGLLMAWTAGKEYSIETVILLPAFLILAIIGSYFIHDSVSLNLPLSQIIQKNVTEAVEMNIAFYHKLPLNPEDIKAVSESKPAIVELFSRIFPALVVIAVLFTVWINVLIGGKLLRRARIVLPRLSFLAEWKAPFALVWIFLAAAGAAFLPQTAVRFTGINIVLMASFIYFLQGLAIVSFIFQNKNISPFFRWLIYFLIAIQQMLMIAIAAIGFFDLWVDFRKYFRKDQLADKL